MRRLSRYLAEHISRFGDYFVEIKRNPTSVNYHLNILPFKLAVPYRFSLVLWMLQRLMTPNGPIPHESASYPKRDYAILLFFVMTGLRRNEVIGLKGKDLEFKDDRFLARCKVKGGDFVWREIGSIRVREALFAYLESCKRTEVLKSGRSIWTRHDKSGKPGSPLSSHSFAKNLKKYATESGLEAIHIHQTRHTFARMVSEDTGSLVETQEALGHRNLATTRVYVNSIAVKKDKHSGRISERLGI